MAQGVALRKKIPVVEIFGPTVQGEGMDQGRPCHFIRFGGCDFKCVWCDTPHAVLPHLVRQAKKMDTPSIVDSLASLAGAPMWVILTGGNPCLHELSPLISELHDRGFRASVETQGTRWKDWLLDVDRVCVSPKGPSSKMPFPRAEFTEFMDNLTQLDPGKYFLKIVVFDHADFEFAKEIHNRYPVVPFYLSAGNDAGSTVGEPGRIDRRLLPEVRSDLLEKARWLTNRIMVDPAMKDAIVQAQYHVLMWGNELGH